MARSGWARNRLPWLGLGLLLCVVLAALQSPARLSASGESAASNALGFFGGALGCALVLIACSALGSRRPRSGGGDVAGAEGKAAGEAERERRRRFALIVCAVLGTTTLMMGLIGYRILELRAVLFGVAFDLPSLLMGAGSVLLLQVWAEAYALLTAPDFLMDIALAHLVAAACWVVAALLPAGLGLVLVLVVFVVVSGIAALFAALEGATSSADGEEAAVQGSTFGHRVRTVLSSCWYPAVGLVVCVLLYAILYDQTSTSVALAATKGSLTGVAGPVVLAAVFAAIAQRWPTKDAVDLVFRIAMPAAAAVFLISPNFDSLANVAWDELVCSLQNAGTMAFYSATFYELAKAARTSDFSIRSVLNVLLVACMAAAFVGLGLYAVLGEGANIVPVLLFVVYLTVALTVFAVGSGSERRARKQEKQVFEGYLRTRCAGLAREHALTARETEILMYLGRGHTPPYIAETLYISENTVRTHTRQIYKKMGVTSREELLALIDRTEE